MEHQGTINNDAADHLLFFAKAEEILRMMHDISKFFSWEEKRVLEEAANVITKVVFEKMGNEKPSSEAKKVQETIEKLRYSH